MNRSIKQDTKEKVAGRVALVTGAAMGIGAAIAERLGHDGHSVIVADINGHAAAEMVARLETQGIKARTLLLDVGSADSVSAAFADLERCDVLVNNAGIAKTQAFLDCDLSDWQRVMNVNVTGTLLCGQHAARLMRQRNWGRIINLSSISGMRASMGRTAYGTSKSAIIGLTRQMAIELAEFGITVNGVAPGPIDTPLTQTLHSALTRESFTRGVPMRRYGTPEEVAGAVAFLASEDASFISGHIIPVDGGYMASGVLEI
ncbi:NAD(P)-dependent dehydrogenase, short-chain alcohol dehydrogenase family [Pseudomonas asturiensis]|uniref:NAD(P)-dependent dehydrogenase, short-chain alcohol dehydrogenase family n=1 Tax=Pseudomonas asturiensis TaxID=1190415 RepID=A0A1M7PUB8_9PSED|nr:SDR family NAD(P)-dependent oxidoreductase [Pseudomonas asturiensis]SHN21056.1 NAD(P)-dependent dehydrogenase, short-chain alcohol dehydrogenase family [Pseudomonas asturiensis]